MSKDTQASAEASAWPAYYTQQAGLCHDPDLRRFYHAGLPPADTPLRDVSFLALDFETTGLNPQQDAIISIGMVPFSLEAIRPSAGHYWVVKPPWGLSAESIAFHHITHSEVAAAPALNNVLGEILAAMAGHVPVVHFRHIERPFLDNAVTALRGEHCLFPLIDTMSIEADHTRHGLLARLRRLLGMRQESIRLADSRERYNLPAYTSHHAKVDAMATAELFQAQVACHYSPDIPIGDLWL